MELIYVNTPKMRVSNITINTDNDDLIVLKYLIRKLDYNDYKYTHAVHHYAGKILSASVNSTDYGFGKGEDTKLNTKEFCSKIATELNSYNDGLTDIAKAALCFYWEELYAPSEPEEKWLMSDSVTKLYAEYLMEYK